MSSAIAPPFFLRPHATSAKIRNCASRCVILAALLGILSYVKEAQQVPFEFFHLPWIILLASLLGDVQEFIFGFSFAVYNFLLWVYFYQDFNGGEAVSPLHINVFGAIHFIFVTSAAFLYLVAWFMLMTVSNPSENNTLGKPYDKTLNV